MMITKTHSSRNCNSVYYHLTPINSYFVMQRLHQLSTNNCLFTLWYLKSAPGRKLSKIFQSH